MKCILKNNRASFFVRTLIFTLFFLCVASVAITSITMNVIASEVKHTSKQHINNLSSIIKSDTYKAIKQGNLEEYNKRLHHSDEYKNHLLNTVIDNIVSDLKLQKNDSHYNKNSTNANVTYSISNFTITQKNYDDRIKYTVAFQLDIPFHFLGQIVPNFSFTVSYDTYHIKDY